jgi:hypothetical protein
VPHLEHGRILIVVVIGLLTLHKSIIEGSYPFARAYGSMDAWQHSQQEPQLLNKAMASKTSLYMSYMPFWICIMDFEVYIRTQHSYIQLQRQNVQSSPS